VFIKFLRFVTEDDDDFVFYVDSLVVVIAKFRGRNSVAGKDHATAARAEFEKAMGTYSSLSFSALPLIVTWLFGPNSVRW
jgi:hypothetical protein